MLSQFFLTRKYTDTWTVREYHYTHRQVHASILNFEIGYLIVFKCVEQNSNKDGMNVLNILQKS